MVRNQLSPVPGKLPVFRALAGLDNETTSVVLWSRHNGKVRIFKTMSGFFSSSYSDWRLFQASAGLGLLRSWAGQELGDIFSLQDVRHALSDLEAANQELSGIIEKVSNEHRHRAEIVRHHPHEIGLERQVGTSGCLAQIFLLQPGLSTSPYWDHVGSLELMLAGSFLGP
jgi:hypothetical protein